MVEGKHSLYKVLPLERSESDVFGTDGVKDELSEVGLKVHSRDLLDDKSGPVDADSIGESSPRLVNERLVEGGSTSRKFIHAVLFAPLLDSGAEERVAEASGVGQKHLQSDGSLRLADDFALIIDDVEVGEFREDGRRFGVQGQLALLDEL